MSRLHHLSMISLDGKSHFSTMFRLVRAVPRPILSRPLLRLSMSTLPKTDQEWKAVLSPQQFKVLRQQATEAPYTGEYTSTPATNTGHYACAGCSQPLYKSRTKFVAHCGWPAFYEAIPGAVKIYRDTTHGMVREEMRCSRCDGHLGHIFRGEGYKNPTDERHCVNSVSIKFDEKDAIAN